MTERRMLGYVNWAPNHQACYVRVNLPNWKDDIPLSIKATFSDFYYRDFEKGDAVEVERTDRKDARRFKVVRLMKTFTTQVPEKPTVEKEKTMSRDRVRFFIGDRYFALPNAKIKIGNVMAKAFGLSAMRVDGWMRGDGFWVTCRPSQFARFLIYRNEVGITNGFMDLHAELVPARTDDVYDMLAAKAGVTRAAAKSVAQALSYGLRDVEGAMLAQFTEVDVSGNPA